MATRNRKAAPKAAPVTTDAQAEALFAQLQAAPRMLANDAEVHRVERQIQTTAAGRRALLATMKFSGAELIERAGDDEGAYSLALVETMGTQWIEHTRGVLELLESQRMRLLVALCVNPNSEAIQARAAAELGQDDQAPQAAHHD